MPVKLRSEATLGAFHVFCGASQMHLLKMSTYVLSGSAEIARSFAKCYGTSIIAYINHSPASYLFLRLPERTDPEQSRFTMPSPAG
jgi:hypothetical protein